MCVAINCQAKVIDIMRMLVCWKLYYVVNMRVAIHCQANVMDIMRVANILGRRDHNVPSYLY